MDAEIKGLRAPTVPAAPAASLSEFRAQKAARASGSATPPVEKQANAVEKSETAGESANPKQETQEKPKPRAKNAEERAAELRAAGRTREADEIEQKARETKEFEDWKASKADRDREAEELRQLRASRQTPAVPAAPQEPAKPAAAAPAADKPKLKDFLSNPANAEKTHDDVVEEWEEAVAEWRENKRKVETQAESRNRSIAEKSDALRKVHPDFDQYTSGQNFQDTLVKLAPRALQAAAHELPEGMEALYRLAKDPQECRRIAGLSETSQLIELGVMSRAIAAEGAAEVKPPEKPATPVLVSRTPPPTRSLGGISPPDKPDSGKAPTSLSEHRARKTRAS